MPSRLEQIKKVLGLTATVRLLVSQQATTQSSYYYKIIIFIEYFFVNTFIPGM